MTYNDENEIFFLNDVFTINNNNFKIQELDKYGKWIDIIKTEEQVTFYYLKEHQKSIDKIARQYSSQGELDQSLSKKMSLGHR